MDDSKTENEPAVGFYILAWILAGVAASLIGKVLESLAFENVYSMEDLIKTTLFVMPVGIVLSVAAVIGVYALFPRIVVSKVVPYFWVLGGLSVVISMIVLELEARELEIGIPIVLHLMFIADFVLFMFALIWAFKKVGRL